MPHAEGAAACHLLLVLLAAPLLVQLTAALMSPVLVGRMRGGGGRRALATPGSSSNGSCTAAFCTGRQAAARIPFARWVLEAVVACDYRAGSTCFFKPEPDLFPRSPGRSWSHHIILHAGFRASMESFLRLRSRQVLVSASTTSWAARPRTA